MRFLIRILLLLMLGLTYFPASGFSAEFLRPALRIGFTDTEGCIWQDKRLLYQGTAYEFIEALWNAKHKPFEDGYFDAYYDGLLRLFAFMHLSGQYQVIFPTNDKK